MYKLKPKAWQQHVMAQGGQSPRLTVRQDRCCRCCWRCLRCRCHQHRWCRRKRHRLRAGLPRGICERHRSATRRPVHQRSAHTKRNAVFIVSVCDKTSRVRLSEPATTMPTDCRVPSQDARAAICIAYIIIQMCAMLKSVLYMMATCLRTAHANRCVSMVIEATSVWNHGSC